MIFKDASESVSVKCQNLKAISFGHLVSVAESWFIERCFLVLPAWDAKCKKNFKYPTTVKKQLVSY